MSTTSWYSSSKGLAVLPLQQQNVAFPVAEDGAAAELGNYVGTITPNTWKAGQHAN